jgi:hypothetical protein
MDIFIHIVLDSTTVENLMTIVGPTMHNATRGGSLNAGWHARTGH